MIGLLGCLLGGACFNSNSASRGGEASESARPSDQCDSQAACTSALELGPKSSSTQSARLSPLPASDESELTLRLRREEVEESEEDDNGAGGPSGGLENLADVAFWPAPPRVTPAAHHHSPPPGIVGRSDDPNSPCWTTCLDMLHQVSSDRGGRLACGVVKDRWRPVLGPQFRGERDLLMSSIPDLP